MTYQKCLSFRPIRMIVILIGAALAGCAQTATDTSCTAFQPITFSAKQDSAETIRQVRGHNAAWDKICGGK